MSSRTRNVVAGQAARARRRSRGGLPSLSEKQTQAYLAARDVLRRIRWTNTLVLPPPDGGGDDGDRTQTTVTLSTPLLAAGRSQGTVDRHVRP
jgi:hypothetical protein